METKSSKLTGSFSVRYNQFFEKTPLYRIQYGVAGSTMQYAPELSYNTFIPYIDIEFKRKSLRQTSNKNIQAKLVHINKEVLPENSSPEEDEYSILSLSYQYSKLDIIKEFRYKINTEFSKNFSKSSIDLRFRSLTAKDRQLDFRVFAGVVFKQQQYKRLF